VVERGDVRADELAARHRNRRHAQAREGDAGPRAPEDRIAARRRRRRRLRAGRLGRRYVVVGIVNHPNANVARPALEALAEWAASDAPALSPTAPEPP
jgi:hypothetical protein